MNTVTPIRMTIRAISPNTIHRTLLWEAAFVTFAVFAEVALEVATLAAVVDVVSCSVEAVVVVVELVVGGGGGFVGDGIGALVLVGILGCGLVEGFGVDVVVVVVVVEVVVEEVFGGAGGIQGRLVVVVVVLVVDFVEGVGR